MEASALSHAARRGLLTRKSPLLKRQGDERLVALAEIRDMTLLDFTREYARGTVFSAGCLKKAAPPWIRRLLPG